METPSMSTQPLELLVRLLLLVITEISISHQLHHQRVLLELQLVEQRLDPIQVGHVKKLYLSGEEGYPIATA